MPAPSDLCLLQDVKQWVYGNPSDNKWPTNSDVTIAQLITSASRGILTAIQRGNILQHSVSEVRSGIGSASMLLRQYPVIGDLTSLTIDSQLVLKRPPAGVPGPSGAGWVLTNPWDGYSPGAPAEIALDGSCFTRGVGNVLISYTAGYAVTNEAAQVAASGPPYTVAPQAPYGRWAADVGVSYVGGAPFTAVASTAALSHGKYVPPQGATGPILNAGYSPVYTFDASDASALILISYSYTPADLSYAAMKWVGEWTKYKERIGARSRSLPGGGGTESWDLSTMPNDVTAIVNQYRRTMPI